MNSGAGLWWEITGWTLGWSSGEQQGLEGSSAASLTSSPACSSLTAALRFWFCFVFLAFGKCCSSFRLWFILPQSRCVQDTGAVGPVEDWLTSLRSSSWSSLNTRCDLQLFPCELHSIHKLMVGSTASVWLCGEALWDTQPRQPACFLTAPQIWAGAGGQSRSPTGLWFAWGWDGNPWVKRAPSALSPCPPGNTLSFFFRHARGYVWLYPNCWVKVQGSVGKVG